MEDVSVPQMHFEDGWLQTHISYLEPFIIYYIKIPRVSSI